MNITQKFYDKLASQYDKLFMNWQDATKEQAAMLDKIFRDNGFDKDFGKKVRILDCACGIGTQAIGLAALGYEVTASDISDGELAEAKKRAAENNVEITFANADFRHLSQTFAKQFDIVIAMDNALPHMLTNRALAQAIESIIDKLVPEGLFVASIRDYDDILKEKPLYSPPYIHKTGKGQRVSFQTWDWEGERYKLTQYIIDDQETLEISKFQCEYRATTREELAKLLVAAGCREVAWKSPEETGFYQPIVVAKK